ncbi:MAG: ATP-binding protein, partial [Aristaeellaceae bacterium]
RPHKKTLSRQLLLSLLGGLVISVMTVNFAAYLLSFLVGGEMVERSVYAFQLVMLVMIIVLFYRSVNRMILRRLRALSDAMAQVAEGNCDIRVQDGGHDELSHLTDSFNRMAEELKANAFLSRDFARYVSHEFKTPLAVIRNYAEITQSDPDPEETERNMDVIIAEADRLTGLAKDVLELCRLDSTTIIEKKDRFSPASQLRSVILDLQLMWGEKEIELLPELEEFQILSNEALLFRVWQNLIGNAIKFTGRGGRIAVTLRRTEDGFVCDIEDNGAGISEEDKQHIFTPFYAGNRFRNREGSGLGLSLSRKIMDKLGGAITFESAEGVGSTFTVHLPCAIGEGESDEA